MGRFRVKIYTRWLATCFRRVSGLASGFRTETFDIVQSPSFCMSFRRNTVWHLRTVTAANQDSSKLRPNARILVRMKFKKNIAWSSIWLPYRLPSMFRSRSLPVIDLSNFPKQSFLMLGTVGCFVMLAIRFIMPRSDDQTS